MFSNHWFSYALYTIFIVHDGIEILFSCIVHPACVSRVFQYTFSRLLFFSAHSQLISDRISVYFTCDYDTVVFYWSNVGWLRLCRWMQSSLVFSRFQSDLFDRLIVWAYFFHFFFCSFGLVWLLASSHSTEHRMFAVSDIIKAASNESHIAHSISFQCIALHCTLHIH